MLDIQNILCMKPQSHRFRGICLRVEMLGFQAEIDRGLSRDTEGLSIIMNMTNTFVGSLVTKVYAWGGDVVEFTGSAMICVFLPSNTDEKVHEKALQCAWQLKGMSQQNIVTVRVRMSYGDFLVGFLGGYGNQWRYLLTGRCVNDLKLDELSIPSSSSSSSASGRVSHQDSSLVMSKECYELFQDERDHYNVPNNNATQKPNHGIEISAVAIHTQNSTRELYLVQRIQIPQNTQRTPPSSQFLRNQKRSLSTVGKSSMVEGKLTPLV